MTGSNWLELRNATIGINVSRRGGTALCGAALVKSGFQQYTNTQIAAELCPACADLAPDHAARFIGMHHYKRLPAWLPLLCTTINADVAAETWATALAASNGCTTLAGILADNGDRTGADALVWLGTAFTVLARLAVAAADRTAAMRVARRVITMHETASRPYRDTASTTLGVIADGGTLHDWLDGDRRVPFADRITAAIGRLAPQPLTAAATRDLASVVTDVDIPAGTNLRDLVVANWIRRVQRRAIELEHLWDDAAGVLHDPAPACTIELDVTRTPRDGIGTKAGYVAAWPMLLAFTDPADATSTEPGAAGDPLVVTVPAVVAYACVLLDPSAFGLCEPPGSLVIARRLIDDGGGVSGALSALVAADSVAAH